MAHYSLSNYSHPQLTITPTSTKHQQAVKDQSMAMQKGWVMTMDRTDKEDAGGNLFHK